MFSHGDSSGINLTTTGGVSGGELLLLPQDNFIEFIELKIEKAHKGVRALMEVYAGASFDSFMLAHIKRRRTS